jgi:hypothetical protein
LARVGTTDALRDANSCDSFAATSSQLRLEAAHLSDQPFGAPLISASASSNLPNTVLPDGVRFTSKLWSRNDVLKLARAAVAER